MAEVIDHVPIGDRVLTKENQEYIMAGRKPRYKLKEEGSVYELTPQDEMRVVVRLLDLGALSEDGSNEFVPRSSLERRLFNQGLVTSRELRKFFNEHGERLAGKTFRFGHYGNFGGVAFSLEEIPFSGSKRVMLLEQFKGKYKPSLTAIYYFDGDDVKVVDSEQWADYQRAKYSSKSPLSRLLSLLKRSNKSLDGLWREHSEMWRDFEENHALNLSTWYVKALREKGMSVCFISEALSYADEILRKIPEELKIKLSEHQYENI